MRRGRICGIDTVLVGAQIVNQIQSIVSRNIDPLEAAVVTITVFQAGTADNVIPQTATLRGTARSLTTRVRVSSNPACSRWSTGAAQAHKAQPQSSTYGRDLPGHAAIDEQQTAFATSVAGGGGRGANA